MGWDRMGWDTTAVKGAPARDITASESPSHLLYLEGLKVSLLLRYPLLVRDVLLAGLLLPCHPLPHVFELLLELEPLHLKLQPLDRFLPAARIAGQCRVFFGVLLHNNGQRCQSLALNTSTRRI